MDIVISSGHGKYVAGASKYLVEVDEARRVVETVATYLRQAGVGVVTFHDNTSKDQSTNLNTIVKAHNANPSHDLDVSVHFNASQTTSKPVGCEVWYKTSAGGDVAKVVSAAISAASGLKDRGKKQTNNLAFLNGTREVSVLLEICFVDSSADADIYRAKYDPICRAVAESLSGQSIGAGEPPGLPSQPGERPMLAKGDEGEDVKDVQTVLGIVPADGDFGSITEGGVKGVQRATGLGADGIVGPDTWDELDDLELRKANGPERLPTELVERICEIAEASEIASYAWKSRGKMPIGYIQGVACCFALAQTWLAEGDPAAVRMAQADSNNSKDTLTWYRSQFQSLGMDNSKNGLDTLRHLFALMLGLGPWESSGRYCEGRDLSASNVQADTAECGMFQTSWNIKAGASQIQPLLAEFWENPNGFLPQFQAGGVKPDKDDLDNFGTGDGAKHQFLSKYAPAYHAMVTALGLRSLGGENGHWGPIRRKEVELKQQADEMLLEVQAVVAEGVTEPEPEPGVPVITISIDPPGSVRVVIVGGA